MYGTLEVLRKGGGLNEDLLEEAMQGRAMRAHLLRGEDPFYYYHLDTKAHHTATNESDDDS